MWLTLTLLIPLITALTLLFIPKEEEKTLKLVGLAGSLATFFLVTGLSLAYFSARVPTLQELFRAKIQAKIHSMLLKPQDRKLALQAVRLSNWGEGEPLGSHVQGRKLARQMEEELGDVWEKIRLEERELQEMALSLRKPLGIAFPEYRPWLPSLGISYFLGVDGLSLPLIWLCTLLLPICLLYSWNIRRRAKAYFALFLLVETCLLGTLMALDLFLFYFFWEMILVPIYFLILLWGGPRRVAGAFSFFLYGLVSSLVLLLCLLLLYFQITPHTLNITALLGSLPSQTFQKWIFLGLLVAFGLRMALFPFHSWLICALREAPGALSVVISALFLNLGAYGFFRILYPLCPQPAQSLPFVILVAVMALITMFYGALVAMAHKNLVDRLAYGTMAMMAFSLLGGLSMRPLGYAGGMFHLVSAGTLVALLFLVAHIVKDRHRQWDLQKVGGLSRSMPRLTACGMIGILGAVGVPGLSGFVGEILILLGAWRPGNTLAFRMTWESPLGNILLSGRAFVVLALLALLLLSIYLLRTAHRLFWGRPPENKNLSADLNSREMACLTPLVLVVFLLGIWPQLFLNYLYPSAVALLKFPSH